ncbi:MAG: YsnF/AvaK domain-containing protein [Janthinobacterium lividum]
MPYEEVTVPSAHDRQTGRQQNEVAVTGELDAAYPSTVLHLASGRSVVLPTELLLAGLQQQRSSVNPASVAGIAENPTASAAREQVIPLTEEQILIGKQTVETGTVRLHRSTETFTDSASLPVTRVGWEIERIPIGQLYNQRPEIRQEGEETIYPLVEERLVATREYFLIEEVRVRRVATTTERTATVELKRDVLTVERTGAVPNDESLR